MIDGFKCTREVKPISEWVEEQDGKICHPCLVKPLVSYYLGALQDNKADPRAKEMAASLEKAWGSGDVLTITKELDRIKKEVGDNLRKELVTLDCFAQSYEE